MTEKAMAPHSSSLAWKIPWTEEPGRLQSMGSRRVGHDWATSLSLFTFMHWRRKWQPTPVFLPGESQGQRSLVGCCLWGHRVARDWSDLAVAAVFYRLLISSLKKCLFSICYVLYFLYIEIICSVFLSFPGSSVGKESACNAGDLDQEDPLEKETATHSSILAWRILWTEELDGLQSMWSQELDTT